MTELNHQLTPLRLSNVFYEVGSLHRGDSRYITKLVRYYAIFSQTEVFDFFSLNPPTKIEYETTNDKTIVTGLEVRDT